MARSLLSIRQILAWADFFHERTGKWPKSYSGRILGGLGDKWRNVDNALRYGFRGLPGKSSLAQLLDERRGVPNLKRLPKLTIKQIVAWADAYHRRQGRWPAQKSGAVAEAPRESWRAIDDALRKGQRGFLERSSLAQVLVEQRGIRSSINLKRVTKKQILSWADSHHCRSGAWPTSQSGPIREAPGETWSIVATALQKGHRGLPGGLTLARFLARHRGARNLKRPPKLLVSKVLAWCDSFRRRTSRWPKAESGPMVEAPGETWSGVDRALRQGCRGFPGGSSLARLLSSRRQARNHMDLPKLTTRQIARWAVAHHQCTGWWPTKKSGAVMEVAHATWLGIDAALRRGNRGLPGGSSLSRLVNAEATGRSSKI